MQEVQIAEETPRGRDVRRQRHGPHISQRHRRLCHTEGSEQANTIETEYCDNLGTWPKQSQYPIFVTR